MLANSKPVYDHNGNRFKSIKEKCDAYGILPSLYLKRIERGWNEENALMGKYPYEVYGKKYRAKAEIIDKYGLARQTVNKYLDQGYTFEQIIEMKKEPVYDHKGNLYKSVYEKCDAYGIKKTTYDTRIAIGWSEEDALTKPVQNKRGKK